MGDLLRFGSWVGCNGYVMMGMCCGCGKRLVGGGRFLDFGYGG